MGTSTTARRATLTGRVAAWSYLQVGPGGEKPLLTFTLRPRFGRRLAVVVRGDLAEKTYAAFNAARPSLLAPPTSPRVTVRGSIIRTAGGDELLADSVDVEKGQMT